jgi:hypothetical protein
MRSIALLCFFIGAGMWLLSGMPVWKVEPDPRVRSVLAVSGVCLAVWAQLQLAAVWDAQRRGVDVRPPSRARQFVTRALAKPSIAAGGLLIIAPILPPYFIPPLALGAILGGILFYMGWRISRSRTQRA